MRAERIALLAAVARNAGRLAGVAAYGWPSELAVCAMQRVMETLPLRELTQPLPRQNKSGLAPAVMA